MNRLKEEALHMARKEIQVESSSPDIILADLTDLIGNPQGFCDGSFLLEGISLISISKKEKERWFIDTPNNSKNPTSLKENICFV